MRLDQLRALLSMPHKGALLALQRLVRAQAKLLLSTALLESGLAAALRDWRSLEELGESVGSARRDYLAQVVELGVSLGAISARDGRYRLRSRLLRAATASDGEPVAFLLRELSHYHARLLRELPEQIAGAPARDYLAEYGGLVAGASRIAEPFLEPYAQQIAGGGRPLRILEIGCGTGVYLRTYARCHAEHGGVAVDLDAAVVAEARSNLRGWGIADRFDVIEADVRKPPPELDGPFDLVTSFQNVYYFDERERRDLFRSVRDRLAPQGGFALVSPMSGDGFLYRYFDVVLNGTAGCHSLPTLPGILADLSDAGLASIEQTRLLSGPGMLGLLARPAG